MGGEPLLHPDVTKFFEISKKYWGGAALSTNGILLGKKDDEFWECLKENNIIVRITNYPINIDRHKIHEMSLKHSVDTQYFSGDVKVMYNIQLDIEGRQDYVKSFLDCPYSNVCIQLQEGKLFTCAMPAYVKYFNRYFKQNLEVTERDYIDIYKAKSAREIIDFLSRPIPFCRYCNPEIESAEIPFSTSKKEISEWT